MEWACPSRFTEYCHPHNHCKRTLITCLSCPSRCTALSISTTFSKAHPSPRPVLNLPPLLKVRCCRPKKFGRLPEGLSLHQPSQNRTVPLAFRRVSVCVCLVGFASLQSPWAHTLKASLPCSLLPLHRPSPFLQPLQNDNNPSHRITSQNRTIPR